jgi:RHS repeat-associated protein
LGRRIEESIDGAVRRFIYDGDNVYAEYDDVGTVLARHIYRGVDRPVLSEVGSDTIWYHADHLGSIRQATNLAGQVVNEYSYGSYGQVTSEVEQTRTRFRFTGREFDSETGLYFFRARYYDPITGRFIAKDPLGLVGGEPNLYVYASNNPIAITDPSGLSTVDSIQGGLDAAGFLPPPFGPAFDLVNAGISLARGDVAGAALSAGSAVPGFGDAAAACKIGKRANKAQKVTKEALDKARKEFNNKVKPEYWKNKAATSPETYSPENRVLPASLQTGIFLKR